MEINILNIVVVIALTSLTSFIAHMGMAVFHDGIRPVIPEYLSGRLKRPEMASVAFGLSVGFIASVGIGNTLATNLLNPWLLFLATDIIGVVSPNKWLALLFGAIWGLLSLTGIGSINMVLTGAQIDLIGGMASVGEYVVTGFSLFPIIAIIMQFGYQKGLISGVIVILSRVLGPKFSTISADAWTMLVGVLLLLGFAIFKDFKNRNENSNEENIFSERVHRIRKNIIFLMLSGALIALVSNLRLFAGSTVSMFDLAKAYSMTDVSASNQLIKTVATNEFFRGLSFIPLIATTSVTTGVYGVAGFTFVYVVGYLSPNPIVAMIGGAIVIGIEVLLLGQIGNFLGKFPSLRDSSDNIRSSMNLSVEFALLIGSVLAATQMASKTTLGAAGGFLLVAMVYLINEVIGRKIMRMAVGPIAAILTGIILNILYFIGLIGLVQV